MILMTSVKRNWQWYLSGVFVALGILILFVTPGVQAQLPWPLNPYSCCLNCSVAYETCVAGCNGNPTCQNNCLITEDSCIAACGGACPPPPPTAPTCNGVPYDPDTMGCCNGKLYSLATQGCCSD